jgi:hypothetical protein
VLADIKDLALKTEMLERKKKAKPKGTRFQINPVEKMQKMLMPSGMETEEDTKEILEVVYQNTEMLDEEDTIKVNPKETDGAMTMQPEGDTPILAGREEQQPI